MVGFGLVSNHAPAANTIEQAVQATRVHHQTPGDIGVKNRFSYSPTPLSGIK